MKMKKNLLALLVAILLCVTALGVTVSADAGTDLITYEGLQVRTEQDFAGLRALYSVNKTKLAELEATGDAVTFGVLAAAVVDNEGAALTPDWTIHVGAGALTAAGNTQLRVIYNTNGGYGATNTYTDADQTQFAYTVAYLENRQNADYLKTVELTFRAFYIVGDADPVYIDMDGATFGTQSSMYKVANHWKDDANLTDKRAINNILRDCSLATDTVSVGHVTTMPEAAKGSSGQTFSTKEMQAGLYKVTLNFTCVNQDATAENRTDYIGIIDEDGAIFNHSATITNAAMSTVVYAILDQGVNTFTMYSWCMEHTTVNFKTQFRFCVESVDFEMIYACDTEDTITFTPKSDLAYQNGGKTELAVYVEAKAEDGTLYYAQADQYGKVAAGTPAITADALPDDCYIRRHHATEANGTYKTTLTSDGNGGYTVSMNSTTNDAFGNVPNYESKGGYGGATLRYKDEIRFTVTAPAQGYYDIYMPYAAKNFQLGMFRLTDDTTVAAGKPNEVRAKTLASVQVGGAATAGSGYFQTGWFRLFLLKGENRIVMKQNNATTDTWFNFSQMVFVRNEAYTVTVKDDADNILGVQKIYKGEDAYCDDYAILTDYYLADPTQAQNITADKEIILTKKES